MVSIKSLAVLLFAAAVTAIPLAGDKHGDKHGGNNFSHETAHEACGAQKQEFYCCNKASASKTTDAYTAVLKDVNFQCNTVTGNVLAIDVLNGKGPCKGESACCSSKNDQNGPANVGLECISFASLS